MKAIIIASAHANNVHSFIEGRWGGTGNKIDLRIGEIIESLLSSDDTDDECPVRKDALQHYGKEIFELKEDIMNKLSRLEEIGWFKEIYLYKESDIVVVTF